MRSPTTPPRRTAWHAAAWILLGSLALAACGGASSEVGGDTADGESPAAQPTDDGADAATTTTDGTAFPATIEHKFGSTEISAEPERVVSVGFNDHDTLLALGVTPVGVREWYGEYPHATWPWAQDELGDAEPEVLSSAELEFEAIAALEPDLIVGIFSGMTEQDYGLLSEIAPTVAQPAEYNDYGTPWREVTQIYGRALGASDRAEDVIAEIDERFEQIQEEHLTFTESTGAVAYYADGQIGAYVSQDLRSRLLTDMGFTIPERIDEAAGEGAFFAPLSLEQADLIDVDALLWVTATEAELQAVEELAVRETLTASQEGREVFLPFELNGAMSFSSPLSIPYFLDGAVPMLKAAVDGDPSTPIPSPSEAMADG